MLKNAFGEYCYNLLNTADCNSYKHVFFLFYILSCSYFFTSARKPLQHLQHPERVNEVLRCHIGAQSNGRLTGNMAKRRSKGGDRLLHV
jgi:hypothetical protein